MYYYYCYYCYYYSPCYIYVPQLSVSALLDQLTKTMASQDDCMYVSAAPADTIYGSHIVHTLLHSGNSSSSSGSSTATSIDSSSGSGGGLAEMTLAPYDSKATAEHGELFKIC